jgi:hypothetical protein
MTSQATTAETKIATVTEPKINFGQECVNSLMEEMGPSSLLASLDGSFLFSTSSCSRICIKTLVLVIDSTAHAQLLGPSECRLADLIQKAAEKRKLELIDSHITIQPSATKDLYRNGRPTEAAFSF